MSLLASGLLHFTSDAALVGPVNWCYVAEIFPLRVREDAMSIVLVIRCIVAYTSSYTLYMVGIKITPYILVGSLSRICFDPPPRSGGRNRRTSQSSGLPQSQRVPFVICRIHGSGDRGSLHDGN